MCLISFCHQYKDRLQMQVGTDYAQSMEAVCKYNVL